MAFITAVAEALFGLLFLFIVVQIWKIQKSPLNGITGPFLASTTILHESLEHSDEGDANKKTDGPISGASST